PMNRRVAMIATGVVGVRNAQANIAAAFKRPLTMSVWRKRKRRKIGVVNGFITRLPANTARTSNPDAKALRPKPTWKRRGKRNGMDAVAMRNKEPPQIVTA